MPNKKIKLKLKKDKKQTEIKKPVKPKTIIKLENINRDFKLGNNTIRVLKDINLEIYQGDLAVIYGPSGCGKSTLLNIILGILPPTDGTVSIDDEVITDKKQGWLAKFRLDKFGVIYQSTEWIGGLNLLENICLPLGIAKMSRKMRIWKANENLKGVGVFEYAKYDPKDLSGGQQQKAALARALVNNPTILVADEPTGNLDSKSAEKIMELLNFLNKNINKTILMVTHDMNIASHASHIIHMKDGQIK